MIRSLEPDEKPIRGASQLDDFEEGDKVEALYKGKGTKWFSGVVKRVNRDGTYEIRYDDGDSEVTKGDRRLRLILPHDFSYIFVS